MGSKEVFRTKTLPFILGLILRERGRECQNMLWLNALATVKIKTFRAPAAFSASAQAETVAPVVNTSSTSRISSFCTNFG